MKNILNPCILTSYSLNLYISNAAKIQAIRNAFNVISESCTFHCSAKRSEIPKNKIKEIKPHAYLSKLKSL